MNNSSRSHSSSHSSCPIPGDVDALKGTFVKVPLESDVLFGRGKVPLEHPGNKRMRNIVDMYSIPYHSQLKTGKRKIAQQVYDEVMHGGTRFLKRVDWPHHGWTVVDNKTAMDKISHALRCKKNANRLMSKSQNLAKRFHLPIETTIPQPSCSLIKSNAYDCANPLKAAVFSDYPVDEQILNGVSSLLSLDPAAAAAQVCSAREQEHIQRNLESSIYSLGLLSNPRSVGTKESDMPQSHLESHLLPRREMENIVALQLLSPLNRFFPPL